MILYATRKFLTDAQLERLIIKIRACRDTLAFHNRWEQSAQASRAARNRCLSMDELDAIKKRRDAIVHKDGFAVARAVKNTELDPERATMHINELIKIYDEVDTMMPEVYRALAANEDPATRSDIESCAIAWHYHAHKLGWDTI